MLLVLLLIILIIVALCINYIKYRELPTPVVEYSIKFSTNNSANNERKILLFLNNFKNNEQQIFNKYNIDKTLQEFYFNNVKNPREFILGKDKDTQKVYFSETNGIIYGLAKKNNKYEFREYKPIKNLDKSLIDKFLGIELSNKLYKIIDNKFRKITTFEKYENKKITSYHFNFKFTLIKSFYNELKQLLTLFNCKTIDFESWFNKNKNLYIAWIGITKKNNEFEFTIYYRSNPL
jgi:hypothetical protein